MSLWLLTTDFLLGFDRQAGAVGRLAARPSVGASGAAERGPGLCRPGHRPASALEPDLERLPHRLASDHARKFVQAQIRDDLRLDATVFAPAAANDKLLDTSDANCPGAVHIGEVAPEPGAADPDRTSGLGIAGLHDLCRLPRGSVGELERP